jgi:hypothetical protein
MTEPSHVYFVPGNTKYPAQSGQWYIYVNNLRLYEWTISWPESRGVVFCKPAWEFAPFFEQRGKLETTIDLNGVMQILLQMSINEESIRLFKYALACHGHTRKLLKWQQENAVH